MEKPNKLTAKKLVIIIAAVFLACLAILGALAFLRNRAPVASEDDYGYVNPDETQAETDEGFVIDGVLDEEQYQKNNWLYLHNTEGGADVDIAMTSYYGDKGMYFVYDVTERTPIFVNTDRASYLNSCIEMYLAPNTVTNLAGNSIFEIDLLPTGDMTFKKSNGKGGYVNVATTDDKMAVLGATTKGGEVNTEECNGYVLELFIPWDYMEKFDLHKEDMEDSFVYVDPAHITSFNYAGTDTSVDRYWYFFAQQQGASFSNVYQYFRFNKYGALGTVPITLEEGDNYTITGDPAVVPGMWTTVTITPEQGYAINSVLVNDEEYIQKVNYNEDGTVILKVRGTVGGLKVSASAVVATEGNKTLSGTIVVNKLGGGSLEGVSASYKGPKGERPLEFDSNGKFALTDLAQGYYTIIVEKEGYEKVTRTIYLNRDIETEIALEYQSFDVVSGTCWILDNQNHGILNKFGGAGVIMSKDAFNKFTVEANFKYHPELVEEADTDYFTQQRQGLRIKFSNEKVWHIDLMKENDKYIVQYAKFSGDNTLFGWRGIHEMSDAEIAKFTSDEGIKLEVQRDGKYANVYLDDKLIAVEILDDEFSKCTAQIGFESWTANREIESIPYSITGKTDVDLSTGYFGTTKGWDLTNQYKGLVALIEGGRGNLKFADKFINMDLTIKVRDDQTKKEYDDNGKEIFPRNDVLFVFENGAHVSFGITSDANGAWIQSMNNSANEVDGKETPYIYKRWTSWGKLTEEEFAQYKDGGVDFRIVRYGTEVTLYIGDRMVAVADLTNNDRGVTADMPAEVTFRHYDDAGVRIEFPFSVKETFDLVTINCVDGATGKLTTQKDQYFVGDTVVLSAANADTYPTSMTVNGKDAAVAWDYTHTFTATEKEYTVEGTFADKVFVQNKQWDLSKQNEGLAVLSEGGRSDLKFYDKYTDMDLTVTVRDDQTEKELNDKGAEVFPRNDVLLVFENGAHVSFGITSDAKGAWIQSLNNSADQVKEKESQYIFRRYSSHGKLTEEEFAEYKDGGVELRIVRAGTDLHLYIGDRKVTTVDLTKMYQNSKTTEVADSGITADTAMNVTFRHYDDAGVKLEVPFEVSTEVPETVKITDNSKNGTMATDQRVYLVGDTISLTGKGEEGYYAYALKINGINVNLNTNETYSFEAAQSEYTLEGLFAERIWKYSKEWSLLQQNDGKIIVPNGDGDSGWVETVSNEYGDVDMTFTLRDQKNSDANYRAAVRLTFTNGEYVTFTITNDRSDNDATTVYELQNIGGTIHDWGGADYTLTKEQVEKLTGEEGLEFRILRIADGVDVYIDGTHAYGYDLSVNKEGEASEVADKTLKIGVRHYGNAECDTVIPFTISDAKEPVEIKLISSDKGTPVTKQMWYYEGQTVIAGGEGNDGYFCTALEVDGTRADLGEDGTYSFDVTKDSHTIEGIFYESVFVDNDAWSLVKQNVNEDKDPDGVIDTNGIVVLPKDHANKQMVQFYDEYTDIDLRLTARDYVKTSENPKPAVCTVVKFTFKLADGTEKTAAFRLGYDDYGNGSYIVQSYGNMYKWRGYGSLTADEISKYQSAEGLEYRLVRTGTDLFLYAGDRRVGEAIDLTKDYDGNDSGITATTPATVYIQQDGNVGHRVEIPYSVTEEVETVKVNIAENIANGAFSTEYSKYFVGDVVRIVPAGATVGETQYYYDSLEVTTGSTKVATTIDASTGYPMFIATESEYDVTGTFAEPVFKESTGDWNLTTQNVGVLSVQNCDGDAGWLDSQDYLYRGVSVNVKDMIGRTNNFNMQIYLKFANGKEFRVRLHDTDKDDYYKIQTMEHTMSTRWDTLYTLDENTEVAKLLSEDGIDFKVSFIGEKVKIYLDNKEVKELDLSTDVNGNATNIGNQKVAVTFRFYGNNEKDFLIPYELEETVPTTLTTDVTGNGTVEISENCFIGGTVTLEPKAADGYGCKELKVLDKNNQEVTLKKTSDGKYTFTSEAEEYTVVAVFEKTVELVIGEATGGTVEPEKADYFVGDTIVLKVTPNEGYNCTGLSVTYGSQQIALDKEVTLTAGTYSFTADKHIYNVDASFAGKIFVNSGDTFKNATQTHYFNLESQYEPITVGDVTYEGSLLLEKDNRRPNNSEGDTFDMYAYGTYADTDLRLRVRDDNPSARKFRTRVVFEFKDTNNLWVGFSLTNTSGNSTSANDYAIQIHNDAFTVTSSTTYKMDETTAEKLQSSEGVEFRVVRRGAMIDIYIDGVHACQYDLTKLKNGSDSNIANKETYLKVRSYGNVGVDYVVPYSLDGEVKTVTVNLPTSVENGTITKDKDSYIIGEKVTLTVAGATNYYYDSLKVNGEEVMVENDGTYTFTATEEEYDVIGSFAISRFTINNSYDKGTLSYWNLTNQHKGILIQRDDCAYPKVNNKVQNNFEIYFEGMYVDSDITLTIKDHEDSKENGFRTAVGYYTNNGDYRAYSVLKEYDQDTGEPKYLIGYAYSGNWGNRPYTLTDEEVELITEGEGIEFRVIRSGKNVYLYLDGNLKHTATLDCFDATEETYVLIKHFDDVGDLVEIPFEMSASAPKEVTISTVTDGNGTITLNKEKPIIGEKVTVTVAGNENTTDKNRNYYYKSLVIKDEINNTEEEVMVDNDGNYTFTTTSTKYTITATFAQSIFKTNERLSYYNLTNQHKGIIVHRDDYTDRISALGIDFCDEYANTDITIVAKKHNVVETNSKNINNDRTGIGYWRTGNKYWGFSILNANGTYSVASSGNQNGWDPIRNLTPEEVALIEKGDGIELRVVRNGKIARVYLDGEFVTEYTFPFDATEKTIVYLQRWDDGGVLIDIPYTFSTSMPNEAKINIAGDIANGTVTTDKQTNDSITDKTYIVGEKVTLTPTANTGYVFDSLYVDGEKVELAADGTYTFKTTKTNHEVTATFIEDAPVVALSTLSIDEITSSGMFYENTMKVNDLADPFILDNTKVDGYYYLYGTTGGNIFKCYRSKDLMNNWEYVKKDGAVDLFERNDEINKLLGSQVWAPEVVYDSATQLYYLFFSSTPQEDTTVTTYGYKAHQMHVATSKYPDRDFKVIEFEHTYSTRDYKEYYAKYCLFNPEAYSTFILTNSVASNLDEKISGYMCSIDPHPYVDENGYKYLYWTKNADQNFICGVKMTDWLTPDWDTATVLTAKGYYTVADWKSNSSNTTSYELTSSNINEGAVMTKHNGRYYLTFSVNAYGDDSYQVVQAVADSPLGAFRKLTTEEGGILLSGTGTVTGVGHHSFVTVGEQTYIVYHRHTNSSTMGAVRNHAIDEVKWTTVTDINGSELEVMYVNGPTTTMQPAIGKYLNVAEKLERVTGHANAKYVTDGLISVANARTATSGYDYANLSVGETIFTETTTLTFDFRTDSEPNATKAVNAIMIYNAENENARFDKISKIELICQEEDGMVVRYIDNLAFDSTDSGIPNVACAVFDELNVKYVRITVEVPEGQASASISEVKILSPKQ